MKYFTRIKGLGKDALNFLGDRGTNFIILFNEDVPDAFLDLCVLHSVETLVSDIMPGDKMIINEKGFEVTSVGSEANQTLRGLGHCTISFQGAEESPLPGYISVKGTEPLLPSDLQPGMTIEFI